MIFSWVQYKHVFWGVSAYVSLKWLTAGLWLENYFYLNRKTEEWDLKILLFNYRNDIVLGSGKIYFLEVGAYISLKQATAGVRESRFSWIWLEISHFFKYKNVAVGLENFFVYLLKQSFVRLRRNIVFGSRCIRVYERSQRRHLRRLFLLNLTWNIILFEINIRRYWT